LAFDRVQRNRPSALAQTLAAFRLLVLGDGIGASERSARDDDGPLACGMCSQHRRPAL
jgi:hypothetical protein